MTAEQERSFELQRLEHSAPYPIPLPSQQEQGSNIALFQWAKDNDPGFYTELKQQHRMQVESSLADQKMERDCIDQELSEARFSLRQKQRNADMAWPFLILFMVALVVAPGVASLVTGEPAYFTAGVAVFGIILTVYALMINAIAKKLTPEELRDLLND